MLTHVQQAEYVAKMKSASKKDIADQLVRLKGMQGNSMAPDLKKWVAQRIGILEQL